MTNPDFKTAVKHVLDCVATKGGQTLAQQSGECMGVILAQHYRKSKAGLQIQSGRTSEQLEKEVKQVLLGILSKGEHDRCSLRAAVGTEGCRVLCTVHPRDLSYILKPRNNNQA